MNTQGKSSMGMLVIIMLISFTIAFLWNHIAIINQSIHFILDPTAGLLLNTNANLGMIIITALISLAISLAQKYTIDQELLAEIKKEQKFLAEETKKYKDHPEKLLELQKKQLAFIPKTMEITLKPAIYTGIPIILFFRWFQDYFIANPVKIFGFSSWFWPYLIFSILFSSIFRKLLKLP